MWHTLNLAVTSLHKIFHRLFFCLEYVIGISMSHKGVLLNGNHYHLVIITTCKSLSVDNHCHLTIITR